MAEQNETRDAIINTAIAITAKTSWESASLYDVARADCAMLQLAEADHFYKQPVEQQISS